jgi:hypothetical protein
MLKEVLGRLHGCGFDVVNDGLKILWNPVKRLLPNAGDLGSNF